MHICEVKNNLYILLTSLVFNLNAQNIKIDSLKQIWNDDSQADTNRLKAINTIAYNAYLNSQPDSAFYFAQLQYEFAKKKGLDKQITLALNTQGISYYSRGDYANAIDYFQRSLKISKNLGNKEGISSALRRIGNVYYKQGEYSKAISYYSRCLKIREEIGNKRQLAGVLNNIGNVYYEQGDFSKAISYYSRSLNIREEIIDKSGIAMSLNNIGNIHSIQGNYSETIDYYNRSLKIKKEIGDNRGIATSLNNIGVVHFNNGDYTKAIDYSKRGLSLAKEIGLVRISLGASKNLYEAYKQVGKLKRSLEMHEYYFMMHDSIENLEAKEEFIKQSYKYEYEKQLVADSVSFVKQRELDKMSHQAELKEEANLRYILYTLLVLMLVSFGVYLRIRFIRKEAEKEALLKEIELLKVKTVVNMSSTNSTQEVELNKEKIESAVDTTLNESDWNILTTLYENPTISNKELADKVALSLEGASSSLRKMYRLFDLKKTSGNQRIALIVEVTKISSSIIQ